MTKHYDMYVLKYVDVNNNNRSHCNSFIFNLSHVCALLRVLCVVDIWSDGQHLSGEKRTRAFDVLKLKMFTEVLGQGELKFSDAVSFRSASEGLTLSL